MISPKYHIFICTGCRPNGTQSGMCLKKGSPDLLTTFNQEIEDRGLTDSVMINNTGCFGVCQHGPVAVVYPEGVWYGALDEATVIKICEEHIEKGEPVKELMF